MKAAHQPAQVLYDGYRTMIPRRIAFAGQTDARNPVGREKIPNNANDRTIPATIMTFKAGDVIFCVVEDSEEVKIMPPCNY